MIVSTERGFTIIELMLFLGVSGALFAALMIGVGSTVSQQQYRESVVSFSTFLQKQYSNVLDTQNGSDSSWYCTADGTVAKEGTAAPKGNCVLLGEAVQIKGGNQIDIYRVVGCEPLDANATTASPCGNTNTRSAADANDIPALISYNPQKSDFDHQTETLDWDSVLKTADSNHDALKASFLILRSPSSGLLRVFTSNDVLPDNLQDMLTQDAAKNLLPMCVSGDSGVVAQQSVTINPTIAGPDGIIVNQLDDHCA